MFSPLSPPPPPPPPPPPTVPPATALHPRSADEESLQLTMALSLSLHTDDSREFHAPSGSGGVLLGPSQVQLRAAATTAVVAASSKAPSRKRRRSVLPAVMTMRGQADDSFWQPASGEVTHAVAVMEARKRARESAAVAAAAANPDDDTDEKDVCVILGCHQMLLRCEGRTASGGSNGHLLCKPCLDRWFVSQTALRAERGLPLLTCKQCPVCQCELRSAGSSSRYDRNSTALGLCKLTHTWQQT